MPTPAPMPNLGYGKQTEATIDQANIAMRGMPWYQEQMKQWGQDPGHPTLAKSQSQQILKLAQANGYKVDEGDMEVDDHGNFNPKGHKLRNTLIVAGMAAATIATMGAAGAFSGAAGGAMGAGSAASGAGVAAGALGPTTAASMAATAAAAGAAPAGIAAGAGTAAAAAGAGGGFWSTIGNAALHSVTGGGAAGTGVGGTGMTYSQLAGAAGSAIGKATTASGNNRLNQEQLAIGVNRDNISGNKAAEDALMERSKLEDVQRVAARKDVLRASNATNQSVSPFNTVGPKKYSDSYLSSLSELEKRGVARLQADPTYSTDKMTPLRTYQPLDITDLQGATNTSPSLMEQIGQYAGPVLSTYGAASQQKPLATVRPMPMDEETPANFPYGG